MRSTEVDDVTEAILVASRALVAVAARSLAAVDDDVTLAQFRALVVISTRGPRLVGELAEALDIHASSASRLCDRLVDKGLVHREHVAGDRREIAVSLSGRGGELVDKVTQRRRREITGIVRRIPTDLRAPTVAALVAFNQAAGEPHPEPHALGWT